MQTVGQWLEQLGLVQYAEDVERTAVDLELVRELTDSDLEKLGVLALGHRKKLLKAISELSGTGSAGTTSQGRSGQSTLGRSVGAEAERRQLTVMFCDLAGSTELATKLDPEPLRDLMQAYQRTCREVIERYEGHIAQYLGDGVMAYFGWPRAHEDDAARAIRAGLEVTQALSELRASAPIRARVGIHTGLVVVGETGQGDASIPKAAVGETPNIAARLQSLADPGSVVVSERTRALASGLYEYAELGVPPLKGVTEPLRVFRVMGVRAVGSRFEASRSESALTPLVGREEEVALLLRRWQEAKGGEGQVVLIAGEPGIGKSRLTRALRDRLAEEEYTPLRYQCSPYHVHSALYSVIEQMERAAGFARDDTPEQKLDKLEVVLAGSEAQAAPLFAAMLSLPLDRYPPLNLSPQKQKEKTLEALAAQIEALARRQPVLMIYEDAHWIDPTTQECLDLLVPRLQTLPVLLIVTYRPEYTPKWAEQAHVTVMGLAHLARRQGAELVTRVAGDKALPAEVLEHIVAHTDGVPLFVEELTKSILESKLLREEGDRYVLDGPLPALAIPTTLRDSLIARLDRLAPVREVAQIGACIGREFAYDLLAAVSPLKGAKLDNALAQLTASGLLFRRGAPPEATYTFKHALVQDAAYDSLLKTKRASMHAKIAEVLEKDFPERVAGGPEVIAHHLTEAGLNDRAVPYWMRAGEQALLRVAFREAIGHLTTALRICASMPPSPAQEAQELDIRVMLGAAYMSALGHPAVEVLDTLEPARGLAIRLGARDKLVQILFHIWSHHLNRCQYPSALKVIEALDALSQSREDSNAFVMARASEASTRCCMGDFPRARRAADMLFAAYDTKKHGHLVFSYNHDPKCRTLNFSGYSLWALGYPDQARRDALLSLDLARQLGHAFNLCWSLMGVSWTLLQRGETRLMREWCAEANVLGREHALGLVVDLFVPVCDGLALIADGEYAAGYRGVSAGYKAWRGVGGLYMVPHFKMMLARALMGLARADEARPLLDEALEIIVDTGHRMHQPEVHRVFGELLLQEAAPDVGAAQVSFLTAVEVARSQEAKGYELRAATSLARLWREQGRHREARELLAPIYNWFTEGFETKDLKDAKALLRQLS